MLASLLIGCLANIMLLHDIHISYGSAELHGNTFSGKISYYKDDLVKAVSTWYKKDMKDLSGSETDTYEKNYFRNYFRVWEEGSQLVPLALERTEDENSVMFTFLYKISGNCRSLKTDHRSIFEVYGDHINIMSFAAFGNEYNYIYKPSAPTYILKKQ
jgi:hypothetical protein